MEPILWIYAKISKLIDYLTYDLVRGRSWVKGVPPPKTPAGLRPEEGALDNHGCYVEPPRTYELRMAFVARAATPKEIKAAKDAKAIRELMQNVGRN